MNFLGVVLPHPFALLPLLLTACHVCCLPRLLLVIDFAVAVTVAVTITSTNTKRIWYGPGFLCPRLTACARRTRFGHCSLAGSLALPAAEIVLLCNTRASTSTLLLAMVSTALSVLLVLVLVLVLLLLFLLLLLLLLVVASAMLILAGWSLLLAAALGQGTKRCWAGGKHECLCRSHVEEATAK